MIDESTHPQKILINLVIDKISHSQIRSISKIRIVRNGKQ